MLNWSISTDPFWTEFDRLQKSIDQLARQMRGISRFPFEPPLTTAHVFPPMNVTRDNDSYLVTAELPGLAPEDLEIRVEGDRLTVQGQRRPETLGERFTYHRKERPMGTFQRSLNLPNKVEAHAVQAHYKHGVLTITLPIEPSERPKRIAVTKG